MAGGKLTVQIGADITDFEKKLKEVEFDIKELSKVKLDRLKLGLDTKEINNQIKDAKNSLATLKDSFGKTGTAIGSNFAPKVANGSNALMQFSRIAQDAPYGIIGIGNNITATAESFSYLKQQTGSTGGALKALASSLMGTGGILLGVSLLTTGLTLLSQSGLTVGDVIDKLTGNFDEFGGAVKKAREEGLKSAGKEVESLRELVAVAQNENIAKKDRLIAVENLQKQYPAYFGNLSNEKILYGNLTPVINEVTKALIAKSVAEKLGDKAGEKFIERLNAQQKFNDSKKALDELDKKNEKELAGLKNVSAAQISRIQARQLNTRNDLLRKAEEERQSVIKLVKEYDRFGQVIDKLNQISAPLNQTAPKTTTENNSFFELEKQRLERIIAANKAISENENSVYYERIGAAKNLSKAQLELIDITKSNELKSLKNTEADKIRIIEDAQNKTFDAKKNFANKIKGIELFGNQDFSRGGLFKSFSSVTAPIIPPLALTFKDPTGGFTEWNAKVQAGLTTAEQALLDFNNSVNDLINNSIGATFSNLGTLIGEALATGGDVLSAIGGGLIQALGSFLGQLGDKLITYGLLLAGFGKAEAAFQSGTPPVKIGAGIAMVALGIAAKAAGALVSSAGSKGLNGGSASTSTGSDANNRSFSSGSFSSSASSGGGTVVFEIAGQKLIGVLSNTLNANKRLGGQTTLAIS